MWQALFFVCEMFSRVFIGMRCQAAEFASHRGERWRGRCASGRAGAKALPFAGCGIVAATGSGCRWRRGADLGLRCGLARVLYL